MMSILNHSNIKTGFKENNPMLKTNATITTAIAITLFATAAASADSTKVTAHVEDRYTTILQSEPYTSNECVMVNVPVYGTVQRQGNAAEGALLGMLLGGAIGKGVSGNNDGAAAGAVIGGLIGADKGARPKTQEVVTGYRQERQCTEVTHYRQVEKVVYDYSIITWSQSGVQYTQTFVK
jgi:uncharacterized protein YcfJ